MAPGAKTEAKKKIVKPRRAASDYRIAYFLGGELDYRFDILSLLEAEYGRVEDGGMLVSVESLSDLSDIENLTIALCVAPPRYSIRELNRLRKARPSVKIITLFAMDEVIALEAVSDLVIDFPVDGELLEAEDSTAFATIPDSEFALLLLTSAYAAEKLKNNAIPFFVFEEAIQSVRTITKNARAATSWTINPWIDSDTSLRSANHIVVTIPSGGGSS